MCFIRILFSSFLWDRDFCHQAHSSPLIECDSGGYCPSCLAPSGELSSLTLWTLALVARVFPEHLQLIFLTSPPSWLSWILNLFLLPSSSTFSLSYLAQCFNMDWATLLALTLTLLVWHSLPCLFSGSGWLPTVPTYIKEAPLPLTLFPQGRGLGHFINNLLGKQRHRPVG